MPKPDQNDLRLDLNEGQKRLFPGDYQRYARESDLAGLRTRTARRLEVSPKQLVFTNGAYHALDIIFNFMVADNEEVIMPVPTFAFYGKFERYRRIVFRKIIFAKDLKLPVRRVLRAINKKTKLIYLVNPNNPLGTAASIVELEAIIRIAKSKNILVVIDEVYAEFWGNTTLPLLKKYNNLIVLRSFSKIGLSGLKLGVMVSSGSLTAKLEEMRGDLYNVNLASIVLVDRFLSRPEQVRRYVEEIKLTKTKLSEFFLERGIEHLPSQTNFITVKFKDPALVCSRLKSLGVLIKDLSHFPDAPRWLKSFVRLTVPRAKDLPILLKNLERILTL